MVEMAVVAGRQPEVVADWAAEDSGAAVQEEAVVTDLEAVEADLMAAEEDLAVLEADLMAAEEDLAVLVAEVEEAQVEDLEAEDLAAEEVEAELAAVDLAAQVADLVVAEDLVGIKVALAVDKVEVDQVADEVDVRISIFRFSISNRFPWFHFFSPREAVLDKAVAEIAKATMVVLMAVKGVLEAVEVATAFRAVVVLAVMVREAKAALAADEAETVHRVAELVVVVE